MAVSLFIAAKASADNWNRLPVVGLASAPLASRSRTDSLLPGYCAAAVSASKPDWARALASAPFSSRALTRAGSCAAIISAVVPAGVAALGSESDCIHGATSFGTAAVTGSGFFTLGLEGNVNNSWQFALAFQQYFGSAVPFVDYSPLLSGGSAIYGQGNSLRDRSNVTFAMRYAF